MCPEKAFLLENWPVVSYAFKLIFKYPVIILYGSHGYTKFLKFLIALRDQAHIVLRDQAHIVLRHLNVIRDQALKALWVQALNVLQVQALKALWVQALNVLRVQALKAQRVQALYEGPTGPGSL